MSDTEGTFDRQSTASKLSVLSGVSGNSGVRHAGGAPWRPWDVLSPREWAIEADKMTLDAQVMLGLGVVFSEVLGAEWEVRAPVSGDAARDAVSRELAEHVRTVFGLEGQPGLMSRTFDAILSDVAWFLHYGSMPIEVVWTPIEPQHGWSVPRDLEVRLPSSILSWGEGSRLGPITQVPTAYNEPCEPIHARKLLVFTLGQVGTDWLGRGLARAAWAAWRRRQKLQDVRQIGFERLGQTPPSVIHDPDVSGGMGETDHARILKEQASNIAKAQAGDGTVAIQIKGLAEIDWGTQDGFDGSKIIQAESVEVDEIHAALGTLFLRLGVNGEGNRSLGEVHMGLLRRAASRYASIIAGVFNGPWRAGGGLVGALCELNYGVTDASLLPVLVPTGLEPVALLEALSQLPALRTAGLLTPQDSDESAIRTALDLPVLDKARTTKERMESADFGPAAPLFSAVRRARRERA